MRILCPVVLLSIWVLFSQGDSHADDFRVQTHSFIGQQEKPVAENLTLFSGDVVYDFLLTHPPEISIWNPGHRLIVLLDVDRRIKTYVHADWLLQLTAEIRVRAKSAQPLIKELAYPKFVERLNADADELVLVGDALTYRVRGEEAKQSIVDQYREFADWFARLNTTLPPSPPPFARLELNRALTTHGMVPREVELSIQLHSKPTPAIRRTRHTFAWKLLAEDSSRINQAKRYVEQFEEVAIGRFRKR